MRAGLELVGAVSALQSNAPLQIRIGIATGLVVVGDLIGTGSAQEQSVVGETPNLAARLQGIAEPNASCYRRKHAKATRQSLRARGPRCKGPSRVSRGRCEPGRRLRPSSVESRIDPAAQQQFKFFFPSDEG